MHTQKGAGVSGVSKVSGGVNEILFWQTSGSFKTNFSDSFICFSDEFQWKEVSIFIAANGFPALI